MPSIAAYHPQIVHFSIALLVFGVIFRLVSLTGRFAFTAPAATTLIVIGTVASVLAVQSGTDAHGPVERIPGARVAVQEHEEWGIRTRNIFLAVAALELIATALATRRPPQARVIASGKSASSASRSEAGAARLVYNYAGGTRAPPGGMMPGLLGGSYRRRRSIAVGQSAKGHCFRPGGDAFPATRFALMSIEWTTDVKKDPAAAASSSY